MLLKQMQSVSLDFSPTIQLSTWALEVNVYVACLLYIHIQCKVTWSTVMNFYSARAEVNTDGRRTVCTEASGQKHKMSKMH